MPLIKLFLNWLLEVHSWRWVRGNEWDIGSKWNWFLLKEGFKASPTEGTGVPPCFEQPEKDFNRLVLVCADSVESEQLWQWGLHRYALDGSWSYTAGHACLFLWKDLIFLSFYLLKVVVSRKSTELRLLVDLILIDFLCVLGVVKMFQRLPYCGSTPHLNTHLNVVVQRFFNAGLKPPIQPWRYLHTPGQTFSHGSALRL